MSFFYTQDQIRNQSKTVTRRLGWRSLQPGDILNACEKCQGLKKGEKIVNICQIRVISTREEQLHEITANDVKLEGFADMYVATFVTMFMEEMKCRFDTLVNRIEFEYLNNE